MTGSSLKGDPDYIIEDIDVLESASSKDASFLSNPRYIKLLKTSEAGAIFVPKDLPVEEGKNYLVSENPSVAIQKLMEHFHSKLSTTTAFEGIHSTAVVHPTAQVAPSAQIGPYVVIDADCVVGKGTVIHSHCVLGAGVTVGKDCVLFQQVTLRERTSVGDRVIFQPGAVIGSCGFGYIQDPKGRHIKLQQLGTVEIQDDVEIGANCTIDRARFKKTIIQQGTKIDNLVQIAHNVEIGKHSILISQTGIAGSTKVGNHAIFGGQSASIGHMDITDHVMVAAGAAVSKSITESGKYGGRPAEKLSDHNRKQVYMRNIDKWCKRIEELEERIEELSSYSSRPSKKDRV